jgi:hypothetical protein
MVSKAGDISENPSFQNTEDTRLKFPTTSNQVPFKESEWAMNALHHFLEHPELDPGSRTC